MTEITKHIRWYASVIIQVQYCMGAGFGYVEQKNAPSQKGKAGGKVLTELRHTLREEKRGMTRIIQRIR